MVRYNVEIENSLNTKRVDDHFFQETPQQEEKSSFQRYLDQCFESVRKTKLVKQAIILSKTGIPLRSTFDDPEVTLEQSGLYVSLMDKASASIRWIDPSDEFLYVRVKTRNNEAIVGMDPDDGLIFVTVQKPE
ncbi:dynein light chain roadblock-type 1-like [Toxorhynchites rutilus septentrionalis]|uniref:dynein light chain roadblock-type 1-like n=1 Tax=Toxorhynchites rutilus septentrionalis TaxID=329112 RepID=UPI0024791F76|nr:dynein light chain roadblock-type 1-like [Toxorhynchites rutilus septentrionalis]